MKSELKYIELKSGFGDTGLAWIGMAEFSKSGRTVYFNGKLLKTQMLKELLEISMIWKMEMNIGFLE